MPSNAPEFCAEILKFSRLMLSSAQTENWDALVETDAQRQKLIDALKSHMAVTGVPLSAAQRAQTSPLIQEILKLDEETAALAQRRMADIKDSLSSLGVTKQLNNTYLRT